MVTNTKSKTSKNVKKVLNPLTTEMEFSGMTGALAISLDLLYGDEAHIMER